MNMQSFVDVLLLKMISNMIYGLILWLNLVKVQRVKVQTF